MSWHTPNGNRCLTGAEARLLREAVDSLHDMITTDLEGCIGASDFGIPPFDTLAPGQKLAVLDQVSQHLLLPTKAVPELNATNEATVAAIYAALSDLVQCEIDVESETPRKHRYSWRGLILEAVPADERFELELPSASSRKMADWDFLIEVLSSRVLWDSDFLGIGGLIDADPEATRHVCGELGIDKNYFVAVAPDPKDSDLPTIHKRLWSLCRSY